MALARLGDGFLVGANLPWISYGCDFGANRWQPAGGLAQPEKARRASEVLRRLQDAGARAVRWFVLADGRAGLRADGRQGVIGLDDRFLPDLDAGVALLHDTGLAAILVLFDFSWFARPRIVEGVQIGGRSRLVAAREARRRLLDNVIAPILDRHAHDAAILAWDVINEPEWATRRHPLWPRGGISRRAMRAFIRDVTARVHSGTSQPVTVGCATAASLPLVAGLGLDFYQVHWYDHLPQTCAPDSPVSGFCLDRPVLLGEFPTRGSSRPPGAILQAARASGYAGALAWSAAQQDAASDALALEEMLRDSLRGRDSGLAWFAAQPRTEALKVTCAGASMRSGVIWSTRWPSTRSTSI